MNTHAHELCTERHAAPDPRWHNPHCVECGEPIVRCSCPDCKALPFMERQEPNHGLTEAEARAEWGDR